MKVFEIGKWFIAFGRRDPLRWPWTAQDEAYEVMCDNADFYRAVAHSVLPASVNNLLEWEPPEEDIT